MSTGLDMSLDDMIAKNRKSRGGAGPARGTGPGPTRRNNPNRKSTRSAPYQSAKVQIRSTSVLSSLIFFFFFSLVSPDLSSQICRFIVENRLCVDVFFKKLLVLINLSIRGKNQTTDSFGCIGAGVHLGSRHVLR